MASSAYTTALLRQLDAIGYNRREMLKASRMAALTNDPTAAKFWAEVAVRYAYRLDATLEARMSE